MLLVLPIAIPQAALLIASLVDAEKFFLGPAFFCLGLIGSLLLLLPWGQGPSLAAFSLETLSKASPSTLFVVACRELLCPSFCAITAALCIAHPLLLLALQIAFMFVCVAASDAISASAPVWEWFFRPIYLISTNFRALGRGV